jgi:diaminohydroxyphosphoribosylaminopyrimidine deaminase/5-amino-6-(5-phosphoribosylamino)uracil reductase
MSQDKEFMSQALRLAAQGHVAVLPNPRVGALIVKSGKVVGRGWHKKFGQAHAEVLALKEAAAEAKGATLYCSLEPCSHEGKQPPCVDAVISAGIRRVVIAQKDPNPKVDSLKILKKAGIKVETGVLEKEALLLNPGFNHLFSHNRPYIHAKIATSLDGFMALKNGKSQWLTGALCRKESHLIRAKHQAIMTGIGTVLADDPLMTVRFGPKRKPLRLILDSHLRMPLKAQMIRVTGGPIHIFTSEGADKKRVKKLEKAGVTVHLVSQQKNGLLKLSEVMRICKQNGWSEIMLEAGPMLTGAFIKKGLVDEFSWFLCPKILGEGLGLGDIGIKDLDKTFALSKVEIRALGPDLLWHGRLQKLSI